MVPDDHTDIPALVRDLLAYFLSHRDARGTGEDLARWRIERERTSHTFDQVNRAINWLEKPPNEYLIRQPGDMTPPVFELNPKKIADAERLLQHLSDEPRVIDVSRSAAFAPRLLSAAPAATPLLSQCFAWVDSTLVRYSMEQPLPDVVVGAARNPKAVQQILSHDVAADAELPDAAEDTRALMTAIGNAGPAEPLAVLCGRLRLTPLELQALLLAIASEFDAKYHIVFGTLNDDMGRRSVTLGLACALLGDPLDIRHELERTGALVNWRLLDDGRALPHAAEALRLDPCVVAWVFGQGDALRHDPRLAPLVRVEPWPGANWLRLSAETALVERLRARLEAGTRDNWIAITGGARNGSRASIEAAARLAGRRLLRIVLPASPPADANEVDELVVRLARAARLEDAVPVVDVGDLSADALGPGGLARLLEALRGGAHPVVIIAADVERVVGALPHAAGECVDFELPADMALAAIYQAAAEDAHLDIDAVDAERLAAMFPLPLASIENAVRLAALDAKDRGDERPYAVLFDACRRIASPDLPRFGRRVEPVFTLDDVVLPPDQRGQMDEIVSHVRYAPHVMHRWGFSDQLPYGRGVAALFSGASGTGKTMAAQAIARELGTEAYVVDLSRVVSKYIGESEKNLDAVFTDAERAGAVLVFDEAEALFGKRSEIKDAHDRYANIEVAYLLQRMEAFGGLAILTTNFRQNLDSAFVRRIRFIVDFKKPDQKAREAIWRRCLATRAPLAPDVRLPFLAKRLDLTGGTIQQIAIRAAFAAAAAKAEAIDMGHVLAAARAELLKLGLTATERELAAFEPAFRRKADVA